jgi:hypothetical protein
VKVGPHLIKSRHVAPRTIAPENTTAGMVPHHVSTLFSSSFLDSFLLPEKKH